MDPDVSQGTFKTQGNQEITRFLILSESTKIQLEASVLLG